MLSSAQTIAVHPAPPRGFPCACAAYITISTRHGQPHMARDDIAAFVDRSVRNTFALLGIPVHAYCVMPDHLHLLIGNVTPVDLPGIVFKFVKLTGVLALRYFNVELWQWRHYRQVVEDPATMEALALEILDNPRRSGLAPSNYPYRGRIPCES